MTAISCYYQVPVGSQTLLAQLFTNNNQNDRFNVQTYISGTYKNVWFVALNAQVNLFVKLGDNPLFLIVTTGGSQAMNCTISGYHS